MFQIFSLNRSNFIDLIVLSIILFLGLVFRIANERERNCDSLRDYNDIEDVEHCKEFLGAFKGLKLKRIALWDAIWLGNWIPEVRRQKSISIILIILHVLFQNSSESYNIYCLWEYWAVSFLVLTKQSELSRVEIPTRGKHQIFILKCQEFLFLSCE